MVTLLENPIPIILLGILAEAVLGVMLVRTGRGVLLWPMVGVLALVLAGVGLEWLVVTDREEVEAVLDGAAAALVADDLPGVLEHVAESATHTHGEARRALSWVRFSEIRIHDLRIEINELTSPPTATARFTARVSGEAKRGDFGHSTQLIGFAVRLRRNSGRWLITEHDLENAPGGF